MKIFSQRMTDWLTDWVNESMNDKGVCRTASATRSLLVKCVYFMDILAQRHCTSNPTWARNSTQASLPYAYFVYLPHNTITVCTSFDLPPLTFDASLSQPGIKYFLRGKQGRSDDSYWVVGVTYLQMFIHHLIISHDLLIVRSQIPNPKTLEITMQ